MLHNCLEKNPVLAGNTSKNPYQCEYRYTHKFRNHWLISQVVFLEDFVKSHKWVKISAEHAHLHKKYFHQRLVNGERSLVDICELSFV